MTTKHTPGPWRREIYIGLMGIGAGSGKPGAPEKTIVGGCGCCDSPYGVDDEQEAEANAHLIAAAPELLAALEQMLAVFVDDPLTHQYTSGTAADAARDAIAKARGAQ